MCPVADQWHHCCGQMGTPTVNRMTDRSDWKHYLPSIITSSLLASLCIYRVHQWWDSFKWIQKWTRMHSSRMGTVRCSGRRGWGVSTQVGCLPRGCLARECLLEGCHPREGFCPDGGCLPRECVCPGGVCLGGVHPPCGQNSWHTLVKTLPFRNYCCGR